MNGIVISWSDDIEDAPSHVALFHELGGVAHHYTSDKVFRVWLDEVGFVLA